jgi:hypothetical protein
MPVRHGESQCRFGDIVYVIAAVGRVPRRSLTALLRADA